jgi:hypothetical protein
VDPVQVADGIDGGSPAAGPVVDDVRNDAPLDGGTGDDEVDETDPSPQHGAGDAGDAGNTTDQTTIILRNTADPAVPTSALPVFVSAPDGTLLSVANTDAEGKVQLEVPPGSTVTAVVESSFTWNGEPETNKSIVSLLDVPNIDPLYLNVWKLSGDFEDQSEPAEIELTMYLSSNLPGSEGNTGTLFYPCGRKRTVLDENQPTGFRGIYTTTVWPCQDDSELEVWARVGSGWGYNTVSISSEPSATMYVYADNAQWDDSTLFADGIPDGLPVMEYQVSAAKQANGTAYAASQLISLATSPTVMTVQVPHTELHHLGMVAKVMISDHPTIRAYANRTTSVVEDLHWNVSEDLALFNQISFVDQSIADRPSVSWSAADTGNLGDYIETEMYWRDISWTVYLPGGRDGIVQLPILPAGLDRYAPLPEDIINSNGASIVDDLAVEGYAGMLSQPYDPSENYNRNTINP